MTTIAERFPLTRRVRFASVAHAMVVAGFAPAAVHMLDVSSTADFFLAMPFVAGGAAFAFAFPSIPRPLAAWSAFVAGAIAFADGGIHVAHLQAGGGLTVDDVLGFATGLGGLSLLGSALLTSLRPKPERPRSRRWASRLGVVAAVPLTAFFAIMPLFAAVYLTHKPGVTVASTDLRVAHEDVTLLASDGVELPAWWIPSRNGRAVILVHGSGGNRGGGIESRAVMLARHGYGVLLYDARRGDGLGWSWYRDIYGAIAFLEERGHDRIGALGLSTGGEAVLEAAGRDRRIDAVVSEGAQARTVGEARKLGLDSGRVTTLPVLALSFTAYRVIAHATPPEPLHELMPRIAPRPTFLMSAGSGYERNMNRIYRDAARGPVTLWEMPSTAHTGGLKEHPREYEQRVVSFFDENL